MVLLTEASRNLFTRPPEEHYPSFEALQTDASAQRDRCTEHDAKDTSILFSENGESLHFGDLTFDLTPYALAQLAAMAKVPLPVLERLTPETRAKVLNQTLPRNKRYKVALADGTSSGPSPRTATSESGTPTSLRRSTAGSSAQASSRPYPRATPTSMGRTCWATPSRPLPERPRPLCVRGPIGTPRPGRRPLGQGSPVPGRRTRARRPEATRRDET